jgi:hypothetical protein
LTHDLAELCPDCLPDPDFDLTLKKAKYEYAQQIAVSSETVRRWLLEVTSAAGEFYQDDSGFLRWRGAPRCEEHQATFRPDQSFQAAVEKSLQHAPRLPAQEDLSIPSHTHIPRGQTPFSSKAVEVPAQ